MVSPCFNGGPDLRLVLTDLSRLHLADARSTPIELSILVIDNASAEPLDTIPVPPGLDVTFLRLTSNTGGSGGYNAGMATVLRRARESARPPEFIWLLDSDARPHPRALAELVDAMDRAPEHAIIGSAIAEPDTGNIFEVGGAVDPILGQFYPAFGEDRPPTAEIVTSTYAAACSALVRTPAVADAGLFPDVFLNADDVEWCIRLARHANASVGATTRSVVRHPRYKFGQTLPRYFIARNAFGPIDAMGFGWRVRLFRALRELPRALAQVMIGRPDLAELHLRGLEDAAAGRLFGRGAMDELPFERFHPMPELEHELRRALESADPRTARAKVWIHPKVRLEDGPADALEAALAACGLNTDPVARGPYILEKEGFFTGLARGLWRTFVGPKPRACIIPVRGRPNAWCRGRVQIEVTPDAFVVRTVDRRSMLRGVAGTFRRGLGAAWKITRRSPASGPERRLPDPLTYPVRTEHPAERGPARA